MRDHFNHSGAKAQPEPIVIVCEDELIHTDEHPYCNDATCPCQADKQTDYSSSQAAMTDLLMQRIRGRR